MKTKSFFLLILIGALLLAGLFLFLDPRAKGISSSSLKPSQLNFSESNELPSVKKEVQEKLGSENSVSTIKESFSLDEKSQWQAFEDILKVKNDNDPRLDRDLKKISPRFREALYEKYSQLPAEDHSRRGLVVYLIGREISSIEDLQFLKKIYQESPCLSMADCKSSSGNQDPHNSAVDQTTLVYEQLSGLYLIERQISQNPNLLSDAASRSGIVQVLAQAESFPVPAVHDKAIAIRTKYGL